MKISVSNLKSLRTGKEVDQNGTRRSRWGDQATSLQCSRLRFFKPIQRHFEFVQNTHQNQVQNTAESIRIDSIRTNLNTEFSLLIHNLQHSSKNVWKTLRGYFSKVTFFEFDSTLKMKRNVKRNEINLFRNSASSRSEGWFGWSTIGSDSTDRLAFYKFDSSLRFAHQVHMVLHKFARRSVCTSK